MVDTFVRVMIIYVCKIFVCRIQITNSVRTTRMKEVIFIKFSERLVKIRENRGLTQSAVAERANMSPRAIQNYEITDRQPKGTYLIKLAKALDVPEAALLSDEGFFAYFINNKVPGIEDVFSEQLSIEKDTEFLKKSLSFIGGSALLFPPAIGVLIGASGAIAINNVIAKSKKKDNILKDIYKEQARLEGIIIFVTDKIDSFREAYEVFAVKTQQDEVDISEYKTFIQHSHQISIFQEYRFLLKQKSSYFSLLSKEVEKNFNKDTEIVNPLLSKIKILEEKERDYVDKILNINF